MLHRIVGTRLMPVTASLAIHLAMVGSILLLPAGTASREAVLIVELSEPQAPPAPEAPPAVKPDPRPLTLPKPVKTPMPAPPRVEKPVPIEKPVEPPPAPRVEEATPPAPVMPAPAASASSDSPSAPSVGVTPPQSMAGSRSASAAGERLADSRATVPTGPVVAALPSDGVTQRAIPRPGYQPQPSYPRSARDQHVEGTTLLRVLVAANGRVGDVIVQESAGHPDLDRAAADTVRRWLFDPARRGSEAVAMWVELPVNFRLKR